ncbi:MAG: hypothetical protein ACFHWZ_04365 [Phycisphaerales bacterium]
MRAAVVRRYGPPEVVSIEEVPDPVIKPGQVLVRIRATGVSRGDARCAGSTCRGRSSGFRRV